MPSSTKRGDVVERAVGDVLAAELPDHRAQLELRVEAEAVVDGVDAAVRRPSRQWPLLRSVLLASRSKTQMRRSWS